MTQGLTLNGVLSGVKGLRKAGLGTLVLGNSANTFSGTLAITAGMLAASMDSALGAASTIVQLSANSATQGFRATDSFTTARQFLLAAATNALDVTTGNTLTLTSPLGFTAATNALNKNDNGTLLLSASNATWGGTLNINAGVVRATTSSALGNGMVNISPNSSADGSALQLAGSVTVANTISLQGVGGSLSGGINFGGQLQSVSGVNTTAGTILLSYDAVIGSEAGSTLNVNGGVYNPTPSARTLSLVGSGTININSALTAATATPNQFYYLNKYGTGTANITTAQPTIATGQINVNGGTLALVGAGTLAGGTATAYVNPGGNLLVNDSGTAIANRLGGRPIYLNHATFGYVVNGGTASSESLGTLSSNTGTNVVQVATSGQNSTLTFSAFSYPTGATSLFRAAGTGAAFGTNANKVLFTTAPTLTD